jgi:hypothetical protein
MAGATNDAKGGLGRGWQSIERHESPEAIARLVERMISLQREAVSACPHASGAPDRGQHKKQLLGALGTLRIRNDVPADVRTGPFAAPGSFRVACRISNGQSCAFDDHEPDVRGVALKFFDARGREVDVLVTREGGRTHAKNATDFVAIAEVLMARNTGGARKSLATAVKEVLRGNIDLRDELKAGLILTTDVVFSPVKSTACEDYWGSVVSLGECAFKHVLLHDPSALHESDTNQPSAPDYLRHDLLNRLAKAPLRFTLCLQFYANESDTPINDASRAWHAGVVPVAELEIPRLPSNAEESAVQALAFNPANGFTPLGITVARAAVYGASAELRGARDLARQLLLDAQ